MTVLLLYAVADPRPATPHSQVAEHKHAPRSSDSTPRQALLGGPRGADAEAIKESGLERRPLRILRCGRLAAIVSEHERAPAPDVESLWAYEQVLERAMRQRALLPARFGTTFAGEGALLAAIAERERRLWAALERVRGAVEIAVREAPPAPLTATRREPARRPAAAEWAGESAGGPGRAYMLERLAGRRRSRALGARLERELGGLVRAQSPRGEGAYALLVDRAHVEEVARRVDAMGLLASGPWAPFSFTGEPASGGEREAHGAGPSGTEHEACDRDAGEDGRAA